MTDAAAVRDLSAEPVSRAAFAPFGTLIEPSEDGTPFGEADAVLDLGRGTPRFYVMRLDARPPLVRGITRHRRVTQCLAAADGQPWMLAVAPPHGAQDGGRGGVDDPDAVPDLAAIRGFRIPGGTAVKLHRGTWHAGPYFDGPSMAFFNLELSDTNETDHQTVSLEARFGTVLRLA